mgnify:CR=1 FL=1
MNGGSYLASVSTSRWEFDFNTGLENVAVQCAVGPGFIEAVPLRSGRSRGDPERTKVGGNPSAARAFAVWGFPLWGEPSLGLSFRRGVSQECTARSADRMVMLRRPSLLKPRRG